MNTNYKTRIRIITAGFSIAFLSSAMRQEASAERLPVPQPPQWVFNSSSYLLFIFFLILMITIWVLARVNIKLAKALYPTTEIAPVESVSTVEKEPSFLRKVYLKMVDSVPVSHEKDVMLDHDYDGIRELDNNLPPWWKYGFYVTIVFAFVYVFIYHLSGIGKLSGAEYREEVAIAENIKAEKMKANANFVNEENVVLLSDAASIGNGKETFLKFCVACHRADGGGQVGPNLTDDNWIHGGGIKNIFKTINIGVPAKGMIAWKSQMAPKQIQEVASFVITLHGSNPPGAKEPQGDIWIEKPSISDHTQVASADTTLNKTPNGKNK